ncbi:hypothetical protein V5D56_19370 [Cellulosimicrobium sp. PMB13]|uniref:hypothetical protein n=1 Tax=Cellulosimicrobium sp. PMB13 TaxID=3120158 RepID=UPI003F4AFAA6
MAVLRTHPVLDPLGPARTRSRRRAPALVALLAVGTTLAACTGGSSPDPSPSGSAATTTEEAPSARAAAVEGVATLPEEDAAGLSLSASRTFFAASPLAVLVPAASSTDPATLAVAGAAAESVAGPVLVVGEGDGGDGVAEELRRLGAEGAVVVEGAPEAAPEPSGTEEAGSGEAVREESPGTGATPSSLPGVPGLDDLVTVVVDPADAAPGGEPDAGALDAALADLPATGEPETPAGVLALTDLTTTPASAVAGATARASGATVLDVPGGDPRATTATVQGVHGAEAEGATSGTVGLGPSFGTAEDLTWRVETAATGVELPGGGQIALPGKRYVALYGSPGAPVLGVLGEQDVPATIARAQEHAARYEALTGEPVVPTLEIITTVASGSAGGDGNYSNERSADLVRPYVDAARDAGVYVVLDFQPGRTDFLTQVRAYEDLVVEPHVGVALDPEWRLGPDQVHLAQIGSVGVDEVNAVGDYLAGLVRERRLPQKIFLLHQFRLSMVADRVRLDTAHPELATVIHADGQGGQEAKAATWANLHRDAPAGVFWGWKNFYDEDAPMLTPEQTWVVRPTPDFVSYQ